MADLFSPAKFDADDCRIKTAGTGDAIDPKHILVDPDSDNILTNDPATGLKVVAEDFISAEEGNIAKASQADGGVLVKCADMISDAECNAISVNSDGKLELKPEDLISDVMGGNPLGINPDDCKLYINPCLLPGPQNIVSKDEDNLIVEDPEDCSALLKYNHVVSEDAGNLIQPGTDGKLNVNMQYLSDRGYIGAGLVYVEKQDGSHVLQVAACDGLWFEEGTVEDASGNAYQAKWLKVRLDDDQNILFFKDEDGCVDCFTSCDSLSIDFSLNSSGNYLRILDHGGQVYSRIPLTNGLESLANGGITINTLDTLGNGTSDLPISAKAIRAMIDSEGTGGLIWNDLNLLEVDFSKMPMDKIESLMASLRIPIMLEGHTQFYVNINSSAAKDVFRESYIDSQGNEQWRYYGRSPAYPWKTLSEATQILSQNYNLGRWNAYLNVVPATGSNEYSGQVSLPSIARTTGSVVIRPEGDNPRFATSVTTNASAGCFVHTGGEWYVDDADITLVIGSAVRDSNTFPKLISSSDMTGKLHLRRANLAFVDSTPVTGVKPNVRLINLSGGSIIISGGGTWQGTKTNSNVYWYYIENGSILEVSRSGNADVTPEYHVSGSFNVFARALTQGLYRITGTHNDPVYIYDPATAVGKHYETNTGGTIATYVATVADREVYFPGNTAGTMDLQTSSWVTPLGDDGEGFAPIPHDHTTTMYGGGTATRYGHVKLTDSLDDTDHCASSSVALSACAGALLKQMFSNYVFGFQIITGDNYTSGNITFPSAGTWACYLTSAQTNNLGTNVQGWEPVVVTTDSSGVVSASEFVGNNTSGSNEYYRLLAFRIG